jgi:plasmid stabilization system protein ParE
MNRTAISWSQRARRDLHDIGDFIARDKPEAAALWIGKIMGELFGPRFCVVSLPDR